MALLDGYKISDAFDRSNPWAELSDDDEEGERREPISEDEYPDDELW